MPTLALATVPVVRVGNMTHLHCINGIRGMNTVNVVIQRVGFQPFKLCEEGVFKCNI